MLACSGRGVCDRAGVKYHPGWCECFPGFTHSNGRGGPGTIPNCGYLIPTYTRPTKNNPTGLNPPGRLVLPYIPDSRDPTVAVPNATHCPIIEPLWGTTAEICSGVGGNCSHKTAYKCNCTAGYSGFGCEYMDCPRSHAWLTEADPLKVSLKPSSSAGPN